MDAQVRRLFVNFYLAKEGGGDDDISGDDDSECPAEAYSSSCSLENGEEDEQEERDAAVEDGVAAGECGAVGGEKGGLRRRRQPAARRPSDGSDSGGSSAANSSWAGDSAYNASSSSPSISGGCCRRPASQGPLAAFTPAGVPAAEVKRLARSFAAVAGNRTLRMADIQAHLLNYRDDPHAAVEAAGKLTRQAKPGASAEPAGTGDELQSDGGVATAAEASQSDAGTTSPMGERFAGGASCGGPADSAAVVAAAVQRPAASSPRCHDAGGRHGGGGAGAPDTPAVETAACLASARGVIVKGGADDGRDVPAVEAALFPRARSFEL